MLITKFLTEKLVGLPFNRVNPGNLVPIDHEYLNMAFLIFDFQSIMIEAGVFIAIGKPFDFRFLHEVQFCQFFIFDDFLLAFPQNRHL